MPLDRLENIESLYQQVLAGGTPTASGGQTAYVPNETGQAAPSGGMTAYIPDESGQAAPQPTATPTAAPSLPGAVPKFDLNGFLGVLGNVVKIDTSQKESLAALARKAAAGDTAAYASLKAQLPTLGIGSRLGKLTSALGAAAAPAPTGTGGGGGGGGRRGGGGGGGGGAGDGDGTAAPGNGLDTSLSWAEAVLGGDFSNLPMYDEMTNPKYSDPTQNPYIQAMVQSMQGEMQEDWLGQQAALAEQAEAQGRYGSGLYQALSTRANEESQEALAQAISSLYANSYENERSRRAGLLSTFLGAQVSASQVPIQLGELKVQQGQLKVSQGQLGVARGQLGLARSEFAFQKKMTLLGAQQDAVNDYLGILLGIGGMGGTQTSTGSGQYVPSTNPYAAALLGGAGGALEGYALQKKYANPQTTTTGATATTTGQVGGYFTGYTQPNWQIGGGQ